MPDVYAVVGVNRSRVRVIKEPPESRRPEGNALFIGICKLCVVSETYPSVVAPIAMPG